ncbi:MAG: DNA polymerase III subunit chi [Nitrosomonas sp. PRO4]|nr:DNA polymerase III subunit chi [Nitrosomonas sp. PRO4]
MTQIYFYSGSANKLQTVCRLCAKAVQQEMKVMIFAPDQAILEQVDRLLWTFSATSFIPHCSSDVEQQVMSMTPIVLGDRIQSDDCFDILLNLHDQPPPSIDQFERIIEVASVAQEDKLAARERYRFYKNGGYAIQHYELDE